MTGLLFRYDGYKKPERSREMCCFSPRYSSPNYGESTLGSDEEEKKEETTSVKENVNSHEPGIIEPTEKNQVIDKPDFSQVSEMLIQKLTISETNLNQVKGQVELAKTFFDELIFKIESFMQILEIVKANEKKKVNDPQAQVASAKTSKDSVDELLELLQSPVFQNILRQFLINVLARKDDVTNS